MSQEPSLVKDASIGRSFGGQNQLPTENTKSSVTPQPTAAYNSSFSPTTDMSYMYGKNLNDKVKFLTNRQKQFAATEFSLTLLVALMRKKKEKM